MQEICINLDNLKDSELYVEEYICLQMINEGIQPESFKFSDRAMLQALSDNLWIKPTDDGWELRSKAIDLFKSRTSINFDEFWEAFPSCTPSGRPLRASSKEWAGKLTRDYTTCKKKYLSKIKTLDSHNKIIQIVKARVTSKDYEFMNNMETYINQEKWQQDVKYLTYKPIIGKTNEMS